MKTLNYGDEFTLSDFLAVVEVYAPDIPLQRAYELLEDFVMRGWFTVVGMTEDGSWVYHYRHPAERLKRVWYLIVKEGSE